MPDPVTELAEFFHREARGKSAAEIAVLVNDRWPNVADADVRRAVDIAGELLEVQAREYLAEADALDELALHVRRGIAP